MARARNIKPGFAKNEDLAECSMATRLCFALLPTLADREGRLEDRPKRIKGELFAFDSIEVEPMLAELSKHGFIERYVVDGRGLIQIVAFHKHQNPHHREPESVLPPHPGLRLDVDGKWVKPEASTSCDGGEASGYGGLHEPKAPNKPEARPGLDPPRSDLQGGSNRADSGALIPEHGFRSPDSSKRAPAVAPPPFARDPEEPPSNAQATPIEANGHQPTPAGRVCRAMKQAGLSSVNPGDPRLLALLEQGATDAEFSGIAAEAVEKRKGFAWVLTVLQNRRAEAAEIDLAPPPGVDPNAWRNSRDGVINRGANLGLPAFDEVAAHLGHGPTWPVYRRNVIEADEQQRPGGSA